MVMNSVLTAERIKGKEFLLQEFCGKKVSISFSKSKSLLGVRGIIVRESRNTFSILTSRKKTIVIPKSGCIFSFKEGLVSGEILIMNPEDRIKKLYSKVFSK
ncbi:Ribonuclease P protein component 1 [uncultured archaeon]|nr:Ribonuclease P protein component 1 [uncultured archaeon]